MEKGKKHRIFFLVVAFTSAFGVDALARERVVTLNPLIADWTAEIMGKEKALSRVVGASEYSNYPSFMRSIPTVGPYLQLQLEKIIALKPDLILGSLEYNQSGQIEKMKSLGLNVVLLPKESFSGMPSWILRLGEILGEKRLAQQKAEAWTRELKSIGPARLKKRAFFQLQFEPLVTLGKNSFLNEAFMSIGYENVFGSMDVSYPRVSKESVLEKDPDTILVFEMVKNHENLEKIKQSWKNRDVKPLNGDDFSRCSPGLLKALKELQ